MNDVNKIKIKLLKLKKNDSVLDVGCSFGEQAFMMARQGLKITGIDSSKVLVSRFNKISKKEKLNCKGIVGSVEKLPFKNNCFDAVLATEIFEHVTNPEAGVKECFRVVKKNGRVCVSVPTAVTEKIFSFLHDNWVKNSGHINVFTNKEIISLLKNAGFKILRVEYQNFEWSIFWLIHSFLKTDFDDTGSPKENKKVSDIYFRIWNYLFKLRIGKYLMSIGDMIFPKSIYIYLIKP